MVTLPLFSWWLEDPEFNSGLVHYLSCLCVLQSLDRIALTICVLNVGSCWWKLYVKLEWQWCDDWAAISYNLSQSSVLRERNREIQPVFSGDHWCFRNLLHDLCSFSGNPWESDTGGNTPIWNWTPPGEYSVILLNSNHLLYFKVECSMMLFLMQSIHSGGLKDRRRSLVTCDYCWQVQNGVMWYKC